jgi:hypothetical protein
MQAGVYQVSDLKVASQAKSRKALTTDDLLATPRGQAEARDVVALVDGTELTIFAPTGNLAKSLAAIKVERDIKGI